MKHRAFLFLSLFAAGSFAAEPPPAREQSVRVAAISFKPVKFDLAGNADRLEKAFRTARQGNAKIAVAPEGVLEGYVVNEIIAGKAAPAAMKDVAVTINDPVIRRFQALARELEMCLVFGFAERINEEVFNCAVFIDQSGRIRGKHHKMQLAEGSHPDWWFNRLGAESRAFDTPFGRCGIVICNERWNPQLPRILALDGARFLVIPSYGTSGKSQDEAVLARAVESGVPIVEANVGVTLVVNEGRIAAVDRNTDGITFGEITIPAPVATQPEERDRAEREFLQWRELEMKARYEKTMEKAKADVPSESAAEKRGGPRQPGGLFNALDTNKDGVLEPAEIESVPAFLRKLDINGDGRVSQREVFHEVGHFRLPSPRLSAVLFSVLDTNGDTNLEPAELDRIPEVLRALDKNGDGKVSESEVSPVPAR